MFGIIEARTSAGEIAGDRRDRRRTAFFLGVFIWWELHNDPRCSTFAFFRTTVLRGVGHDHPHLLRSVRLSTFPLTQYFQFVLGYSPFKAGLMTAPGPVAIGIRDSLRKRRSSWTASAPSE